LPVRKCQVDQKEVTKFLTDNIACEKVPRELCAPRGCGLKEGSPQCHTRVQAVPTSSPVEECDLEPRLSCRHVTRLVPRLQAQKRCVQVPKEVCGVSKIKPVKKKRPVLKKWCHDPKEN